MWHDLTSENWVKSTGTAWIVLGNVEGAVSPAVVFYLYREELQKRCIIFHEKLRVPLTNQDVFCTRVPVFVLLVSRSSWDVSSLM